jgi:NADH dehydrogenase
MPVVVTGANGFVGRNSVAAFARTTPEVRAYVRRPDAVPALRELGAKVAVGEIDDIDTLEVVMRRAHTVCHLVGNLDLPDDAAYQRANVESTTSVLEAAEEAGIKRFLFLSYPGASPDAANPYLRTKGLAERAIIESGLEFAIFRCTHVYGPGSTWLEETARQARRWPAAVIGSGNHLIAPVFVDDVGAVLAAADDRRQNASGTWGLEGPDRLTGDAFADLLAGRPRRKLHLSPSGARRAARLMRRRISLAALEVLAAESLADAPDAAGEFGVARTSLRDGLARSLRPGKAGPDHGDGAVLKR